MVWALIAPSSFGDFFLDGTFVGRREQLADHFRAMPAGFQDQFSGDPTAYASYVSSKWVHEMGTSIGGKPPLVPLEPHEKPGWFETNVRYQSLGSLIETENQLLAVDQALMDIIERLEPGVHTFWPIRITMPKGAVYPKPYFGLAIGRFCEGFSPEASAPTSWRRQGTERFTVDRPNKDCVSRLAFSRAAFEGANLWRERRLSRPNVIMSDALHDAIVQAGLRVPKLIKMQEVE